MVISALSAIRRSLTWCLLASMSLASVEALGYLAQGGGHALSLAEFAQRYSSTCCVLLIAIVIVRICVWFFLIWLGGVRPGIASFFLLLSFMFLVLTTDVTDLFFRESMMKVWRSQPLIIASFAIYSLIAGSLVSLVVAKILRRSAHSPLSPRGLVVLAFLLIGFTFAAWSHRAGLASSLGTSPWAIFAATAIVAAPILWWFSKAPVRFGIMVLLACAVVFTPLPWALAKPTRPQAPATAAASSHPIKHVILITIDTLREDALGCYDPKDANTPHIDQLARDGTLFANAFSSAPWTMPSVASIMTGMPSRVHQLVDTPNTLPDNLPTIALYLKNAGYRTAAVGYNSILDPRFKLDRGFQEYRWYPASTITVKTFDFGLAHWLWATTAMGAVSTTMLTDQAIDWFKANAQDDSFFWIHYFDPHLPYTPPKEFRPADPKLAAMGSGFASVEFARAGSNARTAQERSWIRALYDGEVRYVDSQVGRLFDTLRTLGIYDDSLIVLTSDHGEEFWDHDRFEHGHTLFNELLHVPLVVKLPGEHRGVTADPYVSLQALLPTLLDLCGISPANAQVLSPPLTPLLRDPHATFIEKPIVSDGLLFFDTMESVIFDHMKYIRSEISGHEMLFNLLQDPQERSSVAAQDADNVAKGRQLLDAATDVAARLKEQLGVGQNKSAPLTQQDILDLKALGYL